MATDTKGKPLTIEELSKWREDFFSVPKNELALNTCTKNNPFEVAISRKRVNKVQHYFNQVLDNEGFPITDQASSGRCWIFSALNATRIPFMTKYNLNEFEFSENYISFWDKIEKSNLFLNEVLRHLKKSERIDERIMPSLFVGIINDGGFWDMYTSIVLKYGLMPNTCFPESSNSLFTPSVNYILENRLRYYGKELIDMHKAKASSEDMNKKLKEQMFDIYKIAGICLGVPPENFQFEYYSEGKAQSIGPITPLEFYNTHVKTLFNLEDKVWLICDSRPKFKYGKLYVERNSRNLVEAPSVKWNNQSIETLMDLATKSLKAGEAVWFSCEVDRRYVSEFGVQDLEILDFKPIFDVDFVLPLSRTDRATYSDTGSKHAMLFTGVHIDENGKPTKFRVENSWGPGSDNGGFIVMTSAWFKEFVLSIALDKKFVPEEIMKVFEQKPEVIKPWEKIFY